MLRHLLGCVPRDRPRHVAALELTDEVIQGVAKPMRRDLPTDGGLRVAGELVECPLQRLADARGLHEPSRPRREHPTRLEAGSLLLDHPPAMRSEHLRELRRKRHEPARACLRLVDDAAPMRAPHEDRAALLVDVRPLQREPHPCWRTPRIARECAGVVHEAEEETAAAGSARATVVLA